MSDGPCSGSEWFLLRGWLDGGALLDLTLDEGGEGISRGIRRKGLKLLPSITFRKS